MDEIVNRAAYSFGVLEGYVADNLAVAEHLAVVSQGVDYYKNLYYATKEDYIKLQDEYNKLAVMSGQYLEQLNQFRYNESERLAAEREVANRVE